MKKRGWGRLLNIGSIAFKTPHQEDPLPATDAGRGGIPALMRILAHECGPFGITANTIATGPFDSELSRQYRGTKPEVKTDAWFRAMLPVGRWGQPSSWGGSPRSCVRSGRRSSPARSSASTAATPRACSDVRQSTYSAPRALNGPTQPGKEMATRYGWINVTVEPSGELAEPVTVTVPVRNDTGTSNIAAPPESKA